MDAMTPPRNMAALNRLRKRSEPRLARKEDMEDANGTAENPKRNIH